MFRADRWAVYAAIAAVAWLAFLYRVVDLALTGALAFREPVEAITRIAGLWVTALGLAILARASYDMLQEPPTR